VTTPDPGADDGALLADALDARAALVAATVLHEPRSSWQPADITRFTAVASGAYRWLRSRGTLRVTSIQIVPGTPHPEGAPVATVFDLSDADEVTFTLTGKDAAGASVPLPDGFSAAWTLADPDATGAVLTPSADNSSSTLGSGVPDSNLLVSVAVTITNADGSTSVLNGAEAVIVQAGDAVTVGIVPGTPTPKPPPAG
jgi:hypothetical protein